MTKGSSVQVKDQVRDTVELGFDTMHRVADLVTFPLAPIDGAIHGTARGVLNWLTDTHPVDRNNSGKKKCKPGKGAAPPPQNPYYSAPAPPPPQNPYYSAPAPPPPPPPTYGQPYLYVYNCGYPPASPPPPPGPPQPPAPCVSQPGYIVISKPHPSSGNYPGQRW